MSNKIESQPDDFGKFQYDLNVYNEVKYQQLFNNSLFNKDISHHFFSIFLFEKADGYHIIDGKEFLLKDYQMNLVFPDQLHSYGCEKCCRAYRFIVSKQILDIFGSYLMFPFSFYKKHPSFELSADVFYNLLYEFECIYHEILRKENIWEIVLQRIRVITLMISKEACRLFFIDDKNIATKRLAEFFKLVMVHFRTEKNVGFYANRLSVSPNYLNIICKKYFDKTASSIINNELILEIKMQLNNSNKSIKEIASELGYKDLSSFSVFFSNNTGMSPRDFVIKYSSKEII